MKMRHKFNAVKCERDNIKFASKAERAYYDKLLLLQKSGEILFFLRQVPISLPGGTIYRCDFVTFDREGEVHFIDVKGMETPEFKIKKREIEAIYPFEIEIVK